VSLPSLIPLRELELSVLGGILLRPQLLPTLDLSSDDFVHGDSRALWDAMANLAHAGSAVDATLLADRLEADGRASPSVIAEAAVRVPTADNVEEYASLLRRHRVGREVVHALGSVQSRLASGDIDGPDAITEAMTALSKIETGNRDDRGKSLSTIVREIYARYERGEKENNGITTGIAKLDAKTGGIPFGVPTLILGPTGGGKSTLVLKLCEGAEGADDTPLIYSYEDRWNTYGQRVIARHTGIPTEVVRTGAFQRDHLEAITRHTPRLFQRRTIVVKAAGMSVDDLVRDVRARRAKHRGRGTLGQLVVVDYVQRIPLPSLHGGTKNDRIGEISKRLADLAGIEENAVVVCSQVGRQVARERRAPTLQDARDCGELENDSKLALGLDRPGLTQRPRSTEGAGPELAPLTCLEIHVLKNSQGEANCFVEVYWDLPTHSIFDDANSARGR
jgi:replicative DNA helicase